MNICEMFRWLDQMIENRVRKEWMETEEQLL